MSVKTGDIIIELDTGNKLTVEGLWGNASNIIDFSGKYNERAGVDPYGNPIFGGRGFRFQDEGVIWEKEKEKL